MAGLYIHSPFCLKKCYYCDFYSEVMKPSDISLFQKALSREIILRAQESPLKNLPIETLYFGGGTPSLLTSCQLEKTLETLSSHFTISPDIEISIEINPGTLSTEKLSHYIRLTINRISIGVQSFDNEELRFLGRIHTAEECSEAIQGARKAGFQNIGIDLIFGFPNQNFRTWQKTVTKAVSMDVTHISIYILTWENRSPMGIKIQKGLLPRPDEEEVSTMYLWAAETLEANGFDHYEISNFAQPGHRCQHNEAYWTKKPYLGFGPSAHSFVDNTRFWNVSRVRDYMTMLSRGETAVEKYEVLNQKQQSLERLMLNLRRAEGVPIDTIDPDNQFISRMIRSNLAKIDHGFLSLNKRGFLLADEIALQLS